MMKQRKSKVNLHDSSNKQENSFDLVDRISALPEDILGRILSILPTQQAVATSILSKQWKIVWRTIHNLDFCHDCYWNRNGQIEYENMKFQIMRCWNGQIDAENMKFQFLRCWNEQTEAENTKFVRFVDRVLLLHNGGLLTKFSLVWGTCCVESQASSWINTAITRNVRELSLCLVSRIGLYEKQLTLPKSVFTFDSLQSLELKGGIFVSVKTVVSLPRLERLKIDELKFKSEKGFENLISRCPMLKYLYLHLDSMDEFTCIVSSASLRHLEIRSEFMCNLKLNAPSLERLEIIGWMHDISVQNSLRSLVEVDFRFAPYYFVYDSIVEGIRAFDCAKALTFSAYVMQALSCATISLSTDFTRLVELETEIFCCDCSPLRDFIQSCDSLEVLTIHQHSRDKDRDYLVSKPLKVPRCLSHPKWTTPTEVPRCLLYSLKKVVMDGYKGYEDERETVRYMLEHGSVLEVVKISCGGFSRDNRKLKFLKEICKFPRKSPVCEVEFL